MTIATHAEATEGPDGLRSGQVAAAREVNVETPRYYERRGLLVEPDRSPGGHRLYPAETVTVLRVIRAAQRLGFTLEEVADLLYVGDTTTDRTRADAGAATTRPRRLGCNSAPPRQLDEVEGRIADRHTIRDTLLAALEAGCDDLVACAGNTAARSRSQP